MFGFASSSFLLLALFLRGAESHGYLKSPRARNFVAYQDGVWYGGTASTYPAESCPHCLNRGGTIGQCGVINGRSYDDNLNVFGQPMAPAIQAQYAQGQEIVVDIVLTAHHKGHFEFFACPIVPGGKATGDCFKDYTLTFVADELYGAPKDTSYPTRAYIAPPSRTINDNTGVPGQFFRFRVKLPDNLSGDLVLLQWHYLTANSCKYPGYTTYPFPQDWGDMQDFLGICSDIPADGNGTPEQFWNCAEISISSGPVSPSTPAPLPAPSPPVPTPTYPTPPPTTAGPTPSVTLPNTGGTCGNGVVGNGVCAETQYCCSQWGWCGTGSAYCAANPSFSPTNMPTPVSTSAPTKLPTRSPSTAPTATGTKAPTKAPAISISKPPTKAPTKSPSKTPTKAPSKPPTKAPTNAPTNAPTKAPSKAPTNAPTLTSVVGTCGNGLVGNGKCPDSSLCCSQWGWCGTGTDFCSGTFVPNATCGNGVIGNGICSNSLSCCSKWGYCGTGIDFCGV
ncbi:Lytic polysaccharide mono-oxygenase [Fragilaria crotonensis]|nr:Lytic polysaccharide mono-oxygenase [Fragilaria crotonensis]